MPNPKTSTMINKPNELNYNLKYVEIIIFDILFFTSILYLIGYNNILTNNCRWEVSINSIFLCKFVKIYIHLLKFVEITLQIC